MVRNQNPHRNSPDCSPYISFKNSWENLVWDQSILPLVINLVILITFTLVDLLMLLGENWCWSLLGPKGLMEKGETFEYMGGQGSIYGIWGVEASPLQMPSVPRGILLSLQYISSYIGKIIQMQRGQCMWSNYSIPCLRTLSDEENDHDYKN